MSQNSVAIPTMSGMLHDAGIGARHDATESLVGIVEPKTEGLAPELTDVANSHDHNLTDTIPQGLGHRIAVIAVVTLPLLGLAAGIFLLWGVAFDWVQLAILFVMYVATGMGITVGFHRLFTHRSFHAGPVVSWFWAVLGSMAAEGPVIKWCAMHRVHHQHSDDELDPHSPHQHGGDTAWSAFKGAFFAHMGWLFSAEPRGIGRYVKDLQQDKVLVMVSRQFPLWVAVGLLLPGVVAGLITWSWTGALLGFIWGGLVRMALVHHVTWSINSVCHIWGARDFNSHDHSRNNAIFGILGFGEGWHNNHHAFPASARHGLAWWQFDSSYLVIRAMEKLRLVERVKVPPAERIEAKRKKHVVA